MTDNSSQLSDAQSILGGLSDFELEQLYSSNPSDGSSQSTPHIPPESSPGSSSLAPTAISLPAGFRSALAGKRPNTSWVWQHGQEIIRVRDDTPFWLCQLCYNKRLQGRTRQGQLHMQ